MSINKENSESNLIIISSPEKWNDCIENNKKKLIVVKFSAKWCGPCKKIIPLYETTALNHPDIIFLSIDVDDADEIVSTCDINSVPTIQFIYNKKLLDSYSSADETMFKDYLTSSIKYIEKDNETVQNNE